MKTKILKMEQDYNEACTRIYTLMERKANAIEPDSPEVEEIERLSLLVEKYERDYYPIEAPNPIEAIKFRMEQMTLKQVDIAPLFGGKTRISEVLRGKRPVTLKMITLLNRYLGISLESLVVGNNDIQLEPEKKKRRLSIAFIKKYFTGSWAAIV